MEAHFRQLTEQVKEYLTSRHLADPDPADVYHDFYGQCRQLEVSEDEFYKVVLKQAVRELRLDENYVDPDPPNPKGTVVELFGERFRSLKRFGEALFAHAEHALFYLEDASLLRAHVNELSNGDQALAFARLYQSEKDPQRRFLTVVYALNAQVGYRVGAVVYATPEALIEAAFKDQPLFQTLHQHYQEGWLTIWLSALDADRFPSAEQLDNKNFLKVVYRCGQGLPVYIKGQAFSNATDLVERADQDYKLRMDLYDYADKGYLFIWADSRGWGHWRSLFKKALLQLKASGLADEELKLAAVQDLLRIMDVQREATEIIIRPDEITHTDLPASKTLVEEIAIELAAGTYAVATLSLSGELPGVSLSASKLIFNEWEGKGKAKVSLQVDAVSLTKGLLYNGHLVIRIQQEENLLPLSFRSVFPLWAYLWGILRYAVFGLFFFGSCRLLAVAFSGDQHRLPAGWYLYQLEKTLPTNYWAYFFALIFTLAGLYGAFQLIRKYELK